MGKKKNCGLQIDKIWFNKIATFSNRIATLNWINSVVFTKSFFYSTNIQQEHIVKNKNKINKQTSCLHLDKVQIQQYISKKQKILHIKASKWHFRYKNFFSVYIPVYKSLEFKERYEKKKSNQNIIKTFLLNSCIYTWMCLSHILPILSHVFSCLPMFNPNMDSCSWVCGGYSMKE